MGFTVKYRNSQGHIDYLVVDVETRAEVFPVIKAKGISAITITEGTAIKKPSSNSSSIKVGKYALIFTSLALIVGIGYFAISVISSDNSSDTKSKVVVKRNLDKKAEKVEDTEPIKPTKVDSTNATEEAAQKLPAVDPTQKINFSATTNTNGEVMETWQTPDGKKHARFVPAKPVFDNVIDQTLSIALSVPPGHALPPMPNLGPGADKEFAAALNKPIVIKEDDPEDVKKAKLLVQAGREAILEELKNGKSVSQIIADHCAIVNDNVKLHNTVREEYNKILEEGDLEAAEEYRLGANEILEKAGAMPVSKRGSNNNRRNIERGQ